MVSLSDLPLGALSPPAQGMEQLLAYGEKDWQKLREGLRASLEEHFPAPQRIIGATVASRLWWPDWKQQRYIPVLQVKVEVMSGPGMEPEDSSSGTEYVVYVGEADGVVKVLDSQPRTIGASRGQLKWGKIRCSVHGLSRRNLPRAELSCCGIWPTPALAWWEPTRYVIDRFNPHWVADQTDFASDTSRDSFDRVMAYYHVDLIQRYFRGLGLFALDECPQLMPLQVILQTLPETDSSQYQSNSQSLLIRRLVLEGKTSSFTDARDPMVVYHRPRSRHHRCTSASQSQRFE